MKKFYLLSLVILITLLTNHAYSQQTDSLKQAHIKYISKNLAISESIAQQVVSILDQYKQEAKAAVNNKSLKDDERKLKLDQLIGDKNSNLQKILTEQQLQKIVPSAEWRKN